MNTRRWVIIGSGLAIMVVLTVVALVVDEHWVEVASWLAGVGGFVVAAVTLAVSFRPASPAGATRSVRVRGSNSGIISLGDGTTNTQGPAR
ncbi:hypothetical protein [Dactylosporangium sp. CA-233914]|uniref:hypothetical protein n=1 Tax=Dactylosporangium sp. CA-233914 TaxID=3239934 RepID=UPI003D8C5D44